MKISKDKIFFEKKKALLGSISFLKALKSNLSLKEAMKISDEAAANYMISFYEEILQDTEIGTQERFNAFRSYYESYPKVSPYCEILVSTPTCIKVRFKRCPLVEILHSEGLAEYAVSSCKSDAAFTEELLKGVKFTRMSSIVNGDKVCEMMWERISV